MPVPDSRIMCKYVKHVRLIPAHDLTIARKTVLRRSAASCGGLRLNGTGR